LDDEDYWIDNIEYVINNFAEDIFNEANPPYGLGNAPGAERCAIIEAWGNHIGYVYADRTYGLNHTNSPPLSGAVVLIRDRHIFDLERFDPLALMGSPNFDNADDAWIPEGLFHDCIDDNIAENPFNVNDPVTDQIQGYTIADCFQSIINSPQTVQEVENRLLLNLPPGQQQADLNTLFQEYGY
jgi:hypothetical protein